MPSVAAHLGHHAPLGSSVGESISLAKAFLKEQSDALVEQIGLLGDSFDRAIRVLLDCKDQIIVTGIGKSGLIARKAAATLTSTGTPAVFMHPVEGLHGDLGVVGKSSVLIALSRSGRTEELVRFVGHFRRLAGHVIAICIPEPSPLAELADIVLHIPGRPEAGPLALAPTTSTLTSLALCDALAMALLDARGFTSDQFARYHPDGSLGRRLLLRASDVMHGGRETPIVAMSARFNDLLLEMTAKRLGMACVVQASGELLGVFTDGDLRRLLARCEHPAKLNAGEAWRQSRRAPDEPQVRCSTVEPAMLAVECLRRMRESQITVLVVSEDGLRPAGVVRLQDLVRAGVE